MGSDDSDMNEKIADMTTVTARKSLEEIRADFPVLEREVEGKPLAYLDNGATSQKPLAVIEAMNDYYRRYNSNVHRGVKVSSDPQLT